MHQKTRGGCGSTKIVGLGSQKFMEHLSSDFGQKRSTMMPYFLKILIGECNVKVNFMSMGNL